MVGAEEIARAERILQIIYREENVPLQLVKAEVHMEAFDNWINHRKNSAFKHYWRAYKGVDPRIEASFNTLLMHFFLVGLVCGRDEKMGIE